jgi:hypothetical protein
MVQVMTASLAHLCCWFIQAQPSPYHLQLQVYCEGLFKRHFAPVLSLAVILRIVLMVVAVLLSLAIAIATGGFWPKLASDIEQPTVHWTGEGLALLEVGLASSHCRTAAASRHHQQL